MTTLEFYRCRNLFYGWSNEAQHYAEKAQVDGLPPVLALFYRQQAKAAAGHALAYLGAMLEMEKTNV